MKSIVGVVCLAEVGGATALAFSLTAGAFLVTSRVVRRGVVGLGAAALISYRYRAGRGVPRSRGRGRDEKRQSWFGPRRSGFGCGHAHGSVPAALAVLLAVEISFRLNS
ncbi:hypothetical protein [Streptomyces sp. NRRL B-24720]|uniref:hypothetical protein n=1 Tax=Streptomyces sp. NRRL B-24720 TaxID=1476876 RepID=UPI0004CBD5D0|nr:hypothetical protein [Streptomyces sp. NRRL B-24720]